MYVILIPSARSLRFGSRLWKVNIDQNWNLFYHYLFQRTPVIYNFISQENVFYLLFISICLVTPINCVCDNINWEIKSNYTREIRF